MLSVRILKKAIGREAVQQASWNVSTSNGAHHTIWAGITVGLAYGKLEIKVDGHITAQEKIWVNVGKLAEFELGGDTFQIRQAGLGYAGALKLMHNGRELETATAEAANMGSAEASPKDESWETWIDQAERFTEPLGEERRVIDNSRSNSTTVRKITVSRQWVQTISLNHQNAYEIKGGLQVKVPMAGGFNASAQKTIQRAYSVSEETTRTYSEEVTITVGGKTKSSVTFRWRQVWQRGVVVGRSASGVEVRAPFEVKLHPTFDQIQEDSVEDGE